MTKRILMLALGLALVASVGRADEWVANGLSVTSASQTITFTTSLSEVWVKNAGANEVFVCPWRNDQTVAACTTSIGRRLEAGEAKAWHANPAKGQFWQAVSLVCTTAETTTVNGDSLP